MLVFMTAIDERRNRRESATVKELFYCGAAVEELLRRLQAAAPVAATVRILPQ